MSPASSRDIDASLPVSTNVLPANAPLTSLRRRGLRPSDAELAQVVDDLRIPRLRQECVDVRGGDRADVRHLFDLGGRRRSQGIQGAEMPGERIRRCLADVADSESRTGTSESVVDLLRSSALDQLRCRFLPHAIEFGKLRGIESVESRGILHQPERRRAGPPACCRGLRCPLHVATRNGAATPSTVPGTRAHPCSGLSPRPPRARRRNHRPGTFSGSSATGASGGRFSSMTLTTSGMTSPARRRTMVSPTRTSLRCSSSMLCSVALATVAPPTNTGSSRATGVSAPVRPTCHSIARTRVISSSAGKLVRNRPARRTRDEPEFPLQVQRVDLVDDAVDLVAELALRRRPISS